MKAGTAGRVVTPHGPSDSARLSTVTDRAAPLACRSPIRTMPYCVASRVSAVTHGLVARIVSHHQLLFISLTRSISTKPGSAKSYVDDMITSHMRFAGTVL